jgi:hypothetical protein
MELARMGGPTDEGAAVLTPPSGPGFNGRGGAPVGGASSSGHSDIFPLPAIGEGKAIIAGAVWEAVLAVPLVFLLYRLRRLRWQLAPARLAVFRLPNLTRPSVAPNGPARVGIQTQRPPRGGSFAGGMASAGPANVSRLATRREARASLVAAVELVTSLPVVLRDVVQGP